MNTTDSIFTLSSLLLRLRARREIAASLAAKFGAQDLILFIQDPVVSMHLPALGFAQTLPNALEWHELIRRCSAEGESAGRLPSPYPPFDLTDVIALRVGDGSILALIGRSTRPDDISDFLELVPLMTSTLSCESLLQSEKSRVSMLCEFTQRSQELAQALDTARRGLQSALVSARQAQSRAEDAIRVRDEFLSIASHELKTPLTSLLLELQFIAHLGETFLSKLPSYSEISSGLTSSIAQARRLGALINTLLDSSRITNERIELNFAACEIVSLIQDVVKRFKKSAYISGCTLIYSPQVSELWLNIDKLRIEQSVENLISNAIKYGCANPIEIRIAKHDAIAEITVRDQGIGISASDQERIFNRFERAVSARNTSGLGLGLYITREIIEAHEGKVTVTSDLNKGSTFRIRLPIQNITRGTTDETEVPSLDRRRPIDLTHIEKIAHL